LTPRQQQIMTMIIASRKSTREYRPAKRRNIRIAMDAARSARKSLIDLLGVKEDEIVLVSAGAGGVGHIAVQIASLFGARVGATASRRNRDFLADPGAEAVIDYTEADDLAKAIRAVFPGGVDKILNYVRGEDADDYVWAREWRAPVR
jgi:NADPH:quinone reductase-like Zn-dependent oxidoreductase